MIRRPDMAAARQLEQERRLQEWMHQEREALERQREELAREIKKVGQL